MYANYALILQNKASSTASWNSENKAFHRNSLPSRLCSATSTLSPVPSRGRAAPIESPNNRSSTSSEKKAIWESRLDKSYPLSHAPTVSSTSPLISNTLMMVCSLPTEQDFKGHEGSTSTLGSITKTQQST